jgi:hypothetical protein
MSDDELRLELKRINFKQDLILGKAGLEPATVDKMFDLQYQRTRGSCEVHSIRRVGCKECDAAVARAQA